MTDSIEVCGEALDLAEVVLGLPAGQLRSAEPQGQLKLGKLKGTRGVGPLEEEP